MGRLSLRFLGPPEVQHDGRVLAFPTRKALALLIYVAVEGGSQPREKLSALFWPDSDAERGRGALRRTLAYLRDALAHADADGPERPHLLVEREALAFDFSSDFDLDLRVVESALRAVRQKARSSTPELQARLRDAVALYRGDFLEGFSLLDAPAFDEWGSVQREAWHRRMDSLFDRLSQLRAESGEGQRAIETAARWVAHHPLNEVAHRRLMQTYFAAGDRAAALLAYEACRAMMARELNADPAPETQALAERIRREAPPERGVRAAAPAGPIATGLPHLVSPMVGRASEFGALVEAFYSVQRGGPRAVSVEGEPGIGKTRLAAEFLGWAAAQGSRVLHGRAFEAGGRLLYQPIVEALRSFLSRGAGEQRGRSDLSPAPLLPRSLSPIWLAELSRLLPELRDYYSDLPPPLDLGESEAQTRLFEAVVRLGMALASGARAPVTVFVDDVHWADPASLDLLRYLARRWAEMSSPVILLFCLRSEELGTNPLLLNWLSGFGQELLLTRLSLKPLGLEDTRQMLESLSGTAPLDRFVRWLFAETSGHPFFIGEMLKFLFEHGAMGFDEGGRWAVDAEMAARNYAALGGQLPPGIREVIRTRLARLHRPTLNLLMAGAVLGQEIGFEPLRAVAGMGEGEGLTALEELLARGLLREVGGSYEFTHDKIREVTYAETGEARRRIFHRRAWGALKAKTAPPAELARHALAAGLAKPAYQESIAAGDEALRLFGVRVAMGHYEHAQSLIPKVQPSASERGHLCLQLGRAYELDNQLERARRTYEGMLSLARERHESRMECAALNRLATLAARDLSDLPAAERWLEAARQVAEASGDKAGLAEAEWNLGQLGIYRMDPDRSVRHGQRALALARELGSQEGIARALNQMAFAHTVWGRLDEAVAPAEEARELYAALGNRAMEADSLCLLSDAWVRSGELERGLAAARAAQTIGREIENAWGQANAAIRLGLGLLESGEYTAALQALQEGIALARAGQIPPLIVLNLTLLGNVYRALLACDAARAAHLEATQIVETLSHKHSFEEMLASELCADHATAGNWDAALDFARRAMAARSESLLAFPGLARWHETRALVRAGESELAEAEVRRFAELIGKNRRYQIVYLRMRASLTPLLPSPGRAAGPERGESGVRLLLEAASLAEAIGLPGELWQLYAELGRLHRANGEATEAQRTLDRSAEIVQTLAAKIQGEGLRAGFLTGTARVIRDA